MESEREYVHHVDSIPVRSDLVDSKPDYGGTNSEQVKPDNITDLPEDAEDYKMDHRKRGVALIFYHEKFKNMRLPDRIDTETDRNVLRTMFLNLGFDVEYHNDYPLSKIEETLRKVAADKHSNHDCLAVAVLTDKGKDKMLAASDEDYDVKTLLEPFVGSKCPRLLQKPKLFFIQACKGNKTKDRDFTDSAADFQIPKTSYQVPCHADFLIWYAAFEGQFASDKRKEPSSCIHCICSVVENHHKSEDLLSLLTGVNCEVKKLGLRNNGRVQVPCFTSSLTKRLCFP